MKSTRAFARFAWLVLLYNIPVILWGAYVRVSFSGDGCGASWPFCDGRVLPQNMARPMAIEFTHRMMTSLDVLLTAVLVFWAFRAFTKGSAVRRYASWSAFFLLVEALLGAGLVLFRLVAHDQSAGRAVYLSAHLTNTMLLLGSLTMTAWLAQSGVQRIEWRRISRLTAGCVLVTVAVSVTGALAALGDTLFPSSSLAAGIRQDFSWTSGALLRLRLFHPFVALAGAAYLLWVASRTLRASEESARHKASMRVVLVTVLQLVIGATNLTLLAPVYLQMIHLLMADLLWISVVVMVLETARLPLGAPAFEQAEQPKPPARPAVAHVGKSYQ